MEKVTKRNRGGGPGVRWQWAVFGGKQGSHSRPGPEGAIGVKFQRRRMKGPGGCLGETFLAKETSSAASAKALRLQH